MTQDCQVREATDIYALAARYTTLRRQGNVAIGCCPIHSEKSASFRVNLPGNRYPGRFRCFGCHASGDAQDLMRLVEGISAWEALKQLAQEAGIALKSESDEEREVRAKANAEKQAAIIWYRSLWAGFNRQFQDIMRKGPPEWESRDAKRAELCGQMMRWIERERATEKGLKVYRKNH